LTAFVLNDYVNQAIALATYEELGDGSSAGRVPPCQGVIAFGATRHECEQELRSTLEDWVQFGLRL
jgi:predicted RNase H-like HicB family nuclease